MMPVGDGGFYLYLHDQVRQASGTQVGDNVEVSVTFNPNYKGGPQHALPPDFAARLVSNAVAAERWETLPPSLQKEILRNLANLKSDDARRRNIDRAMRVLRGATERFLARDWN